MLDFCMWTWMPSIAPTTPDRRDSSKNSSMEFYRRSPCEKLILCLSSTFIASTKYLRTPATVDFPIANNSKHLSKVTPLH